MEEYKKTHIPHRTRVDEFKVIAEDRKFLFRLSKVFQREYILDSQNYITIRQFLFINLAHQINFQYIRILLATMYKFGPMLTFFCLMLGSLIIGMPLFLLYSLLGFYSRKGFIQIWDCVPLMRGIGFSMAIYTICNEIYSILCVCLSLLLFVDIFYYTKLPWQECLQDYRSQQCVPKYSKFNATCVDEGVIEYFSVQDYYKTEKLKAPPQGTVHDPIGIHYPLCALSFVAWALMSIFGYLGFQKFANKTTSIMNIFVFLMLPIFTLTVIGGYRKSGSTFIKRDIKALHDSKFWSTIISLATYGNDPGTIVFTSAIASPKMELNGITTAVFFIKMIVSLWLLVWFVIVMQTTMLNYSIPDPSCVKLLPHDIVFPCTLDILLELPVEKIWVTLWLLFIIYHGWTSSLYTITGIVESLMEILPDNWKKRSSVSFCVCLSGFLLTVVYCTTHSFRLERIMQFYGLRPAANVLLLIAATSLTFIYSVNKVSNDFHFLFKSPPNAYWLTTWTTAPLLLFLTLFVKVTEAQFAVPSAEYGAHYLFKIAPYCTGALILVPIIINAMWIYLRYMRSEKKSVILKPEPTWGPKGKMMQAARLQFKPDRDIRYRNPVLKCKHDCLVNASDFEQEKSVQNSKYRVFVDAVLSGKRPNET